MVGGLQRDDKGMSSSNLADQMRPHHRVPTPPPHLPHRLNMELDFQSLFGLHVHSCTHWLRPRIYEEGAIGQPR
jgi:hypothetical protein